MCQYWMAQGTLSDMDSPSDTASWGVQAVNVAPRQGARVVLRVWALNVSEKWPCACLFPDIVLFQTPAKWPQNFNRNIFFQAPKTTFSALKTDVPFTQKGSPMVPGYFKLDGFVPKKMRPMNTEGHPMLEQSHHVANIMWLWLWRPKMLYHATDPCFYHQAWLNHHGAAETCAISGSHT